MRPISILLVFAAGGESAWLTYQRGWPAQVRRDRRFRCVPLNLASRRSQAAARARLAARRPEAVILLHSVFSNQNYLQGRAFDWIARTPWPKVWFIGNEYKNMPEKMAFAEGLGVSLLVSQIEREEVLELYRERLGCAVVGIPHAGLDPALFAPEARVTQRPIDVGYRSYDTPPYLGQSERRELAQRAGAAAKERGLTVDISLDPAQRFGANGWADFLNRCRGQLGSEAGTDYFELDDRTRLAVLAYLEAHPDAGEEEIHARFFADYDDRVSGRTISGRIVEAAGTKTAQVLLEGEYSGYFLPDRHYISVRTDFSNVDQALDRLADDDLCRRITEAAHEVAREQLTYERLVDRLHAAVSTLV